MTVVKISALELPGERAPEPEKRAPVSTHSATPEFEVVDLDAPAAGV